MKVYKLEYELFEKLSSDFREYEPSMDGKIRCPLCINVFSREDIVNKSLSLEHVIPKKLGGRVYTLSCKSCNNRHGTELDNHLIMKLKFLDAMEGKGSLGSKLIVGEDSTQNIFRLEQGDVDTVHMTMPGKTNNPETVAKIKNAFENNLEEFKVTIESRSNFNRAYFAIIKCAYLAAFQRKGYRYILDPAFSGFQRHLKDTSEGLRLYNPLVTNLTNSSQEIQNPILFLDMTETEFPQSFLVAMKFTTARNRYWGAYLPYPGKSFEQLSAEMLDYVSKNGMKKTVTFKNIDISESREGLRGSGF